MVIKYDRQTLIQNYQLKKTVAYHGEALKRLGHVDPQALRKAAVLIGFVEHPEGLKVLFTKRAAHLKHHPGQVSFPGGKFELADDTLVNTALRETEEETGIERHLIEVFGQMNPLPTISQFAVTPYLAFIKPNYLSKIDQNEVEEVFEVPIEVVLDPRQLHSNLFEINQQKHRVFGLNYGKHFIWGVTAQIIQSLQHHLPH